MSEKKLIGVFGSDISSRLQGNLYSELHKKATELGYNLLIFSGNYDKVEFRYTEPATEDLFALAENIDFKAFVIHAQSLGDRAMIDKLIAMGKRKHIPVFLYDGDSMGIPRMEEVYSINPNYKQGFAEGVRHLIEHHGCRNIFMLGGMRNNQYSDDRIEMYRREMDAHGIPYKEEQIGYGDFWENPATEELNRFLDSDLPTPEAICCANDTMAITAVKVLSKRGLKVPEDVLVTGFDGIEDGRYHFPSISSCEPMLETVSEYVFNVLLGTEQSMEFLIPLKFTPKDSCGCRQGYGIQERMEMTGFVDNMRVNSWQHHMLATMQFELMDSTNLADIIEFMNGTLDLFREYGYVYCFRQDIENCLDYTKKFRQMRVQMNKKVMKTMDRSVFPVDQIFPDFDTVIENSAPEDIYVFRLIHNGDKQYGYVVVQAKDYSSNDLRLIGEFNESVTIVIESIIRNRHLYLANQKLSEMYAQMSEIYIRDTMTGLYNRHGYYQMLNEYMNRADLKDSYVHIISIDMDGMKHINDNYGHLEGDVAIKAVAQAINECFSQPCISARFGGDEFSVALFTDAGDKPATGKLLSKMNHYLQNLPALAQKEYSVVVSLGQAVAKLSEVTDFKVIEKLADDRMYEEKRKHKN